MSEAKRMTVADVAVTGDSSLGGVVYVPTHIYRNSCEEISLLRSELARVAKVVEAAKVFVRGARRDTPPDKFRVHTADYIRPLVDAIDALSADEGEAKAPPRGTTGDRLQTILDERWGPFPTMSDEDLLTELEKRLYTFREREPAATIRLRKQCQLQRRELRRMNVALTAARWALLQRYSPEQYKLRLAEMKADNDKARKRAQDAESRLRRVGPREWARGAEAMRSAMLGWVPSSGPPPESVPYVPPSASEPASGAADEAKALASHDTGGGG